MRFTRTVLSSALALALTVGAAPALAADGATRDISALQGGIRRLVNDRPACPPAQRAIWVDRAATPPSLYIDQFGRRTWSLGEPEFHGWECQPIMLVPVGP